MRRNHWAALGLVAAALTVADMAAAQTMPQQSPRQRAPGVPMAPNAAEASKVQPDGDRPRAQLDRERFARDRTGPAEPNRDVPMPKPVPSIMAPTR